LGEHYVKHLAPTSGRPVLAALSVISVIDDASIRAATNNFLSSHGYLVHTFASAVEFLQSGRLDDPSCVIADVRMPDMNGPSDEYARSG
jgi:FixJ family two-component response regulator